MIEITAPPGAIAWLLRQSMGWLPANLGLEHPFATYEGLTGQPLTAATFPG